MNTYYCPGSGRIKAHRVTLVERFTMWRAKRRQIKEGVI